MMLRYSLNFPFIYKGYIFLYACATYRNDWVQMKKRC